jgi:hypothetical protein
MLYMSIPNLVILFNLKNGGIFSKILSDIRNQGIFAKKFILYFRTANYIVLGVVYTMNHEVVPRPCKICDWLLNSSMTTLIYTKENRPLYCQSWNPSRIWSVLLRNHVMRILVSLWVHGPKYNRNHPSGGSLDLTLDQTQKNRSSKIPAWPTLSIAWGRSSLIH